MPDSTSARYPLLPSTRWVIPVALALGIAGLLLAPGTGTRLIYGVLSVGAIALFAISRRRRPVLVLEPDGYRVEVRGRLRFRVRYAEVRRVRAVPAELALFVDCGDPSRNLLVPPHGYGFRFARQDALYEALLARLEDRVEITDELAPEKPIKIGSDERP